MLWKYAGLSMLGLSETAGAEKVSGLRDTAGAEKLCTRGTADVEKLATRGCDSNEAPPERIGPSMRGLSTAGPDVACTPQPEAIGIVGIDEYCNGIATAWRTTCIGAWTNRCIAWRGAAYIG